MRSRACVRVAAEMYGVSVDGVTPATAIEATSPMEPHATLPPAAAPPLTHDRLLEQSALSSDDDIFDSADESWDEHDWDDDSASDGEAHTTDQPREAYRWAGNDSSGGGQRAAAGSTAPLHPSEMDDFYWERDAGGEHGGRGRGRQATGRGQAEARTKPVKKRGSSWQRRGGARRPAPGTVMDT